MLKTSLASLALIGLLASPSFAQVRGAPIVKGVTSGELAGQVDQTRQQTADLMLAINRNADQIGLLNGRIETLEYELSRLREANERQTLDNETLAQENNRLRQQVAFIQMTLGIDAAEFDNAGITPGAGTGLAPSGVVSGPAPAQPLPGPSSSGQPGGPAVLTPPAGAQARPEGSLGTISASQLPGEAGPLFATARQRLLSLDYAGAAEAFEAFTQNFASDPQAGEAYFWLGEALYQQDAYAESGQAYTTMIRSFPDDARAPDALARLARSMRLLGDTQRACQALDTLPKRYPNASKVVRDLAAVERTRSGCKS